MEESFAGNRLRIARQQENSLASEGYILPLLAEELLRKYVFTTLEIRLKYPTARKPAWMLAPCLRL